MNYSKQGEEILNKLKEHVVHPTAEYIYSVLQQEGSSIGQATVYRNLNKLAKHGVIKKIEGLEDCAHFDHNTFEHYHFMCEECKRVQDVMPNIAPNMIELAEKQLGCKITGYDITLRGICKDCLKKKGQ